MPRDSRPKKLCSFTLAANPASSKSRRLNRSPPSATSLSPIPRASLFRFRPSRKIQLTSTPTPTRAIWSRLSRTARRSLASAISVHSPQNLSWKARRHSSNALPTSTRSTFSLIRRMSKRSSTQCDISGPRSAASTSKTSRRRTASSSKNGSKSCSTFPCSTTTSMVRRLWSRPAFSTA